MKKRSPRGPTRDVRRRLKRSRVRPSTTSNSKLPDTGILAGVYGPVQLSPVVISRLSSTRLTELISALARAEAAVLDIPKREVIFGGEEKAKEGGWDGSTPAHSGQAQWLPDRHTCWQLKAGKAGEPARVAQELGKTTVRAHLRTGGAYVAVASSSVNGKPGRDARLKALKAAARKLRVRQDRIQVYTAEDVSEWVKRFPGVAASFLNWPEGLTLTQWRALDKQHQFPFKPSPSQVALANDFSQLLAPTSAGIQHIHVFGPPGVGKTRLLLETCDSAPWRDHTLYFPGGMSGALRVVQALAASDAVGTLVIDETPISDISHYRRCGALAGGRLRIVTVGHQDPGSETAARVVRITPQVEREMENMLREWWPDMPRESVRYIARISDGYPRLAQLIGEYVAQNPGVSTNDLLGTREVSSFLEKLVPNLDMRHLYALSVLTSLGFSGPREAEGIAVAEAFHIDWLELKNNAWVLNERFGLVRQGATVLYMTPRPLALSLARKAWRLYPRELRALRGTLPPAGVLELDERLKELGGVPESGSLFRQELAQFSTLVDFSEEPKARYWAVLAEAEPALAAAQLRSALETAPLAERLAFRGPARRQVMWQLPGLAWDATTFRDSVRSLAELSIAETESIGNNATGEFVARFQLYLGGTEVPYLQRLRVLDELWAKGATYHQLVLTALAKIADVHETRFGGAEDRSRGPAPPEWRPTLEQADEARRAGLTRLRELLPGAEIADEAVLGIVRTLIPPLQGSYLAPVLVEIVDATVARRPKLREPVRALLAEGLAQERWLREQGEKEAPILSDVVRALHERLRDASLTGRVRELAGPGPWDRGVGDDELRALAADLAQSPGDLAAVLPWLTSGEANGAFELGLRFGEDAAADQTLDLEDAVRGAGPDRRFFAGVITARGNRLGSEWLDALLGRLATSSPIAANLALQVLAWMPPSAALEPIAIQILQRDDLERQGLGALAHGPWAAQSRPELLSAMVRTLARLPLPEGAQSAISILGARLRAGKNIPSELRSMAATLVTRSGVYPTRGNSLAWKSVTNELANDFASSIAAFLFGLQADQDSHYFLGHHADAAEVLRTCIAADPSGVWSELRKILETKQWGRFAIGFPTWLPRELPVTPIVDWLEHDPERPGVLAHFVQPVFTDDKGLESILVERYGTNPGVKSALFGGLISGTSWGSVADRYTGMAEAMAQLARRTKLAGVRRWATDARQSLMDMAKGERGREEDDAIRRR